MTGQSNRAAALVLAVALTLSACGGEVEEEIVWPDLSGIEPEVMRRIDEAREKVAGSPGSAEGWGELAATFHVHGMFDAAAACYERARARAPLDFRWTYFLALAREGAGAGSQEVQERLLDAARLRNYAPLHVRLGRLYLEYGAYDEAERAFNRAVSAGGSPPALRGLGQARLALGDAERAAEVLVRAVQADPRDAAAWSSLSRALALSGRDEPSREAAAKAEQLRPRASIDDPELASFVDVRGASAYHLFARAQRRVGRNEFAGALEDLSRVATRVPDDPDVRRLQARAHVGLGQLDVAIELLRETLERSPEHTFARIDLARMLARSGYHDEAARELHHVRGIAPGDPSALAELTKLYAARDDLDGLIETYEQLAVLRPGDARIASKLGKVWSLKGRPQLAAEAYARAVELEPSSAEAHHQLGLALTKLGRAEEARTHIDRAARLRSGGR